MTKEEIKKFLSGTKVYVNSKSEEIQKKLFSLGCEWTGGYDIHGIAYTNKPFLYIDSKLRLTFGIKMDNFTKHKYREITAKEILALDYSSYRPFKNKEECWQEMLKHHPFGWIKNEAGTMFNITAVLDGSVKINEYYYDYTNSLKCKFIDGTVFGVEEK